MRRMKMQVPPTVLQLLLRRLLVQRQPLRVVW
jgi:hypothetical protein